MKKSKKVFRNNDSAGQKDRGGNASKGLEHGSRGGILAGQNAARVIAYKLGTFGWGEGEIRTICKKGKCRKADSRSPEKGRPPPKNRGTL